MKLFPVAAAVMVAAMTLATAAWAAPVPLAPLAPPPVATSVNGTQTVGSSAASTIFDAMLAIARAAANNPSGAQNATFSYDQALQQYNAGQYDQARQSALDAIGRTAPAPLPSPSLYPLYIPQPAFHPMPLVVNADEADAESVIGLARGQLGQCGNATPPPAVAQQYSDAVAKITSSVHQYLAARAESEQLINYCAAQMRAMLQAAANAPAPPATPIPMASYSPMPVATLIPDPALAQPPVVMPSSSPAPAPHGFAAWFHPFGL